MATDHLCHGNVGERDDNSRPAPFGEQGRGVHYFVSSCSVVFRLGGAVCWPAAVLGLRGGLSHSARGGFLSLSHKICCLVS